MKAGMDFSFSLYFCEIMLRLIIADVNVEHGWLRGLTIPVQLNPSITGAVHIRFLHFFIAHCISAFEPVQDKK